MQYPAIFATSFTTTLSSHHADAQETWTLVGVGDTQVQIQSTQGGNVFRNNMQWVADQYADHNIRFVTQLGDNVQNGGYGRPKTPALTTNNVQEWQRADAATPILDATQQRLPVRRPYRRRHG